LARPRDRGTEEESLPRLRGSMAGGLIEAERKRENLEATTELTGVHEEVGKLPGPFLIPQGPVGSDQDGCWFP
jgi:hypothetical protein